ncbi:uncharacterized protein LOC128311327 isoform X2 [Acinonyx jubatus]|uniref:Uncharacterized protein LOC128311327 isoform X2 n=1 Tax=Acinonyx jubatus TaxID=32536 RepID=A0ABM3NCV7_ACIJB|nr:uncharacterized protein LOC128311327 isoform X2 [Acinonyx jubatus]
MALLASWGGVLPRSKVRMRLRGSGQNGVTSYPVCSPGSAMALSSSVFSSRPLPAFPLSVTRPQAVPRSRVLPRTRLFSPAPYSRRTAALTRSAPPREGLTELRRNVGCSQERPLDPAAAGAPRLRPEASPPQKKLARQSSSSVSGMVENRHTRLAPGFTLHDLVPAPANVAAFRGLPGPGGFHSLHQMSFRQRNRLSSCGPSTSRTPLCSWGFALPTRAPPASSPEESGVLFLSFPFALPRAPSSPKKCEK